MPADAPACRYCHTPWLRLMCPALNKLKDRLVAARERGDRAAMADAKQQMAAHVAAAGGDDG